MVILVLTQETNVDLQRLLIKKKKWGKHEFGGGKIFERYCSRYLRELTCGRKEVCQVIGKKFGGGGGRTSLGIKIILSDTAIFGDVGEVLMYTGRIYIFPGMNIFLKGYLQVHSRFERVV